MTTLADLEAQHAEALRELARQYCDGAFNKSEYRRRRREILARCVHNDFAPVTIADDEPQPVAKVPASSRDWLPTVMVVATLTVAAMMGWLIYSLA